MQWTPASIKVAWAVLIFGISTYYCIYTIINANSTASTVIGWIGVAYLAIALCAVYSLRLAPITSFLQRTWLLSLPLTLVPILGAWSVEFPGSGLLALIWPILFGLFMAYNSTFTRWAENTEPAHTSRTKSLA